MSVVHIGPNLWPFIRSVVECFKSAESVLRTDLIEAEVRLTLVSQTPATASYRLERIPTGNTGTH